MEIIVDGISEQTNITNINEFNDIWKSVTKRIFSSKRFICSIQIDGEPYYDDFDIQILNHFDSIETVEIETFSEMELLIESLDGIKRYVARLLVAMDSLSSAFYGDLDEKDWRLIAQFTQGLDWLYKAITMSMDLMAKTREGLELYPYLQTATQKIVPQIQSMEQLFQEEDYIAIGDLLTYELKPIFIDLDHALKGNG
jgi:hypothetical protein